MLHFQDISLQTLAFSLQIGKQKKITLPLWTVPLHASSIYNSKCAQFFKSMQAFWSKKRNISLVVKSKKFFFCPKNEMDDYVIQP